MLSSMISKIKDEEERIVHHGQRRAIDRQSFCAATSSNPAERMTNPGIVINNNNKSRRDGPHSIKYNMGARERPGRHYRGNSSSFPTQNRASSLYRVMTPMYSNVDVGAFKTPKYSGTYTARSPLYSSNSTPEKGEWARSPMSPVYTPVSSHALTAAAGLSHIGNLETFHSPRYSSSFSPAYIPSSTSPMGEPHPCDPVDSLPIKPQPNLGTGKRASLVDAVSSVYGAKRRKRGHGAGTITKRAPATKEEGSSFQLGKDELLGLESNSRKQRKRSPSPNNTKQSIVEDVSASYTGVVSCPHTGGRGTVESKRTEYDPCQPQYSPSYDPDPYFDDREYHPMFPSMD